jgi:hypothetical protein
MHRHGFPFSLAGEDLETRLSGPLEQKGYTSIIAMCAGADVDFGTVVEGEWDGRVVEEAEGAAGGAEGAGMSGSKPGGTAGGGRDVEAEAEEG